MSLISRLLLTPSQMADKYHELDKAGFEYPYLFKITKANQALFFVGFQHSYDPQNPQFVQLEKYWSEFLAITSKQNRIVLNEGGKRRSEKDKQTTILSGAESSYIAFLATNELIDCVSPEPDPHQEGQLLLKKFTKSEVGYYYFARTVNQWQRLDPKPDFSGYLNKFLSSYEKHLVWPNFDFSLTNLIQIHNQIHNHVFDPLTCTKCTYTDSNPIDNLVSAESGAVRDEHISQQIVNYWNEGKSIFAVFGSGHAFTLEPALKQLLI